MILLSLMLVMPVKRFLAVMVVFLVLGLTASSAMAASDVVTKSTQNIPQTSGCPCCSEKVRSPENVIVQELGGPAAYFEVVKAFNVKDTLKLRNNLNHLGFVPDFHNAVVQLVSYSNGTTEIVKIPLNGKYPGLLIHVRNKRGTATSIAVYKNDSIEVYYYNSTSHTINKLIRPTGIGDAIKCAVCIGVANEICDIGYDRAIKWGCGRLCGIACGVFAESPLAMAICVGACYYACQKVLTNIRVKRVTCGAGAAAICTAIGACKG